MVKPPRKDAFGVCVIASAVALDWIATPVWPERAQFGLGFVCCGGRKPINRSKLLPYRTNLAQ
jgi:hypothetical protein